MKKLASLNDRYLVNGLLAFLCVFTLGGCKFYSLKKLFKESEGSYQLTYGELWESIPHNADVGVENTLLKLKGSVTNWTTFLDGSTGGIKFPNLIDDLKVKCIEENETILLKDLLICLRVSIDECNPKKGSLKLAAAKKVVSTLTPPRAPLSDCNRHYEIELKDGNLDSREIHFNVVGVAHDVGIGLPVKFTILEDVSLKVKLEKNEFKIIELTPKKAKSPSDIPELPDNLGNFYNQNQLDMLCRSFILAAAKSLTGQTYEDALASSLIKKFGIDLTQWTPAFKRVKEGIPE